MTAVQWRRIDLAWPAAYFITALWVGKNLLSYGAKGYLSQGVQDQQAFEWYLAATAHNLATLSNPLFSDLQNYPDGVNLMANAAVIGLGIPLTPLTWLTSANTTFTVILIGSLAATAIAWYWLLRRRGLTVLASGLGGLLAGYAPAMVSHANGHLNFAAQFLIPVIIDRVLRLAERDGPVVRNGVVLGLLVSWQIFIGEEVLLLAAIGMLIAGVVWAMRGKVNIGGVMAGGAIGAGLATAITAYPLWWQFTGPQSYTALWHPPAGNDLAALWGRATRTVGADPWAAAALSMNRTEENAFFGMPLLVLAVTVATIWCRRPAVLALSVTAVLTLWLSLGESVLLRGEPTSMPGLWGAFDRLPIVGNVLPTRLSMIAAPAMAALIAIAVDATSRRWRLGWPPVVAVVAVAYAPMAPTPLVLDPRPEVPEFFTGGNWRSYVDDGSVVAVPLSDIADMRAADWQFAAAEEFSFAEGYFVGPGPGEDRIGQYGAVRTALSIWLFEINRDGIARIATAQQREVFRADLDGWQADVVVLPEREQTKPLLASLSSVLGQPERLAGVYLWDVRPDSS